MAQIMLKAPFSCSICKKAFSKLSDLGDHVGTAHILKKSEHSHESISNLDSIKSSHENISNLDTIENSLENTSYPENVEDSVVDQSESDCEEIRIQSQADREEDVIVKSKQGNSSPAYR